MNEIQQIILKAVMGGYYVSRRKLTIGEESSNKIEALVIIEKKNDFLDVPFMELYEELQRSGMTCQRTEILKLGTREVYEYHFLKKD